LQVAKTATMVQNLGPRLVQQDANRGQGESKAGAQVNRLVCQDCGTVYYSAAAKTMAEEGERCVNCGGLLRFADGPKEAPVTTPQARE
jgi:hypothetical protein